jgi:PAS domain S-box-containing protein
MWQMLVRAEGEQITYMSEARARAAATKLGRSLQALAAPLAGIAQRQGAVLRKDRPWDIQLTGLRAALWAEPSGRVGWVTPRVGNEDLVSADLAANETDWSALQRAGETGRPTLTREVALPRGGSGFRLVVPVLVGGRLEGFLVGVFSTAAIYPLLFEDDVEEHWTLSVLQDDRELWRSGAPVEGSGTAESQAKALDSTFRVRTAAGPEILARLRSPLPGVVLAAGAVIALLLAAALHFAQAARRRAEEAQESEAALRGSEERLRSTVDAALDAVIAMDAEGRVVSWNPRAQAIFGWAEEEAIGRTVADLVIPARYRDDHTRGLRKFLETGEGPVIGRRVELSATRRDGSEFPVELAITAIKKGNAPLFVGFLADISERKRAEEELRESRAHYQALAESLPHMVWTCLPDGRCDYLSRQWVEYTGRPEDEQLGGGWMSQVHPDERARVQAAWAVARDNGETYDVEFRIRRSDSIFRWFKTRAVPLRDSAGLIVKWFGSTTDVEDYKRSQQNLQSQLARLNLLDQTARSIGERLDLQSILQVVIGTLEDQLPIDFGAVGVSDDALEALDVICVGAKSGPLAMEMALPERSHVSIAQNGFTRCLQGELVHVPDTERVEFPFTQRLARTGLHSLVMAPLMVEGRMFGVLIAARRETSGFSSGDCEFLRGLSTHVALAAHQAQLHGALEHAYDDLRQTQQTVMQQERLRALGQMASGIAHDINNAISPVALYTESLLETEPGLSARARGYLEVIQRAILDVAQTVARMREFYRKREPQMTLAPVDLNLLIHQVVDLTRARWNDMPQERGIVVKLATELQPGLPSVMGVEGEFRDALVNLVFNAIDAMPEGGTLTLRTQTLKADSRRGAAPMVCVDVEDTGVGMEEGTRRRCLEPFFTTKGDRGTGLGLAMVYGMIQRHRGEIDIESTPGAGTTIRLTLPTPTDATETKDLGGPRVVAVSGLRILVVDDDPLVLKALQEALEGEGHIVVAENRGQAGIDAFLAAQRRGEAFQVVITDLGMPQIDGRRVASAVKSASPSTPVLLLTGWGQRLEAEGDLPEHVDRVLSKPPKIRDLRQALLEYAGSSRS